MLRGEIYLAYLYPKKGNEVGKLCPVLIYQSDFLNEVNHPTTTILPLSTTTIDDAYPLRFCVSKRDKLQSDSDILIDQIRTIDNSRIKSDVIAKLTLTELLEVDEQIQIVLGI